MQIYISGMGIVSPMAAYNAAHETEVLAGKQGQVLVIDYFKKAKKLDVHFEKLN